MNARVLNMKDVSLNEPNNILPFTCLFSSDNAVCYLSCILHGKGGTGLKIILSSIFLPEEDYRKEYCFLGKGKWSEESCYADKRKFEGFVWTKDIIEIQSDYQLKDSTSDIRMTEPATKEEQEELNKIWEGVRRQYEDLVFDNRS